MKHKYPYELYMDRVWKRQLIGYWFRDMIRMPRMFRTAFRFAKLPTYYPELERKGYAARVWDNIKWTLKNKDVNGYYTSYGLDIKNFRNPDDFMAFREFKLNREGAFCLYPDQYRFDSRILLRDKYMFSCYLSSAIGEKYIPKTIGQIRDDMVEVQDTKEIVSIEEFFSQDRHLICKKIDGECADCVMLLTSHDGKITNGSEPITIREIEDAAHGGRMLLQEVVTQHEDVDRINPYCINTIRIITLRSDSGKIHVFAASIRLGTVKDSFVDNRAVGGAAVGIDENGKLKKYGFQHAKYGTKISQHPVTGTVFEGYQLPYWNEVVDLVKKAHRAIINVQSIGWDVAITPIGPVLIEGNDNWEIANPQDAHGGLKKRWYELLND